MEADSGFLDEAPHLCKAKSYKVKPVNWLFPSPAFHWAPGVIDRVRVRSLPLSGQFLMSSEKDVFVSIVIQNAFLNSFLFFVSSFSPEL